jgi:uncharacterized protein YjbJ (UPF0337 family)
MKCKWQGQEVDTALSRRPGSSHAGHVPCAMVFVSTTGRFTWRCNMNKDQVKGTAEKVKGKVNEAVGKATNNPARELKDDVQQEAGQTRKGVGDVKEAAKDSKKH